MEEESTAAQLLAMALFEDRRLFEGLSGTDRPCLAHQAQETQAVASAHPYLFSLLELRLASCSLAHQTNL